MTAVSLLHLFVAMNFYSTLHFSTDQYMPMAPTLIKMEYQKVFVGKSQFRLKVLSVFASLGTAASRGGGLKGRRQQSLVDIRPVWRQGRAASLNTTLVLSNCDIDDTPLGLHWDCLQYFSMMCGFKDLCYIQNCLY